MNFRKWYKIYTEGANEDLALNILHNDTNILKQLKNLKLEPKYLPALAFFYPQESNLQILKQYFDKFTILVNRNKINYKVSGKVVELNKENVTKWLRFTEIIDSFANLQPKKIDI